MEWAEMMTDVHGPRYANSPGYDAATAWARDTFAGFGLDNVNLEAWGEYGYGWENQYTSVHLTAPRYQPIIAYPIPGTGSTDGKVVAPVVLVDTTRIFDEADLAPHRGKLRGCVVLIGPERKLEPNYSPHAVRLSDDELQGMARPDDGRSPEANAVDDGGGAGPEPGLRRRVGGGLQGLANVMHAQRFGHRRRAFGRADGGDRRVMETVPRSL